MQNFKFEVQFTAVIGLPSKALLWNNNIIFCRVVNVIIGITNIFLDGFSQRYVYTRLLIGLISYLGACYMYIRVRR